MADFLGGMGTEPRRKSRQLLGIEVGGSGAVGVARGQFAVNLAVERFRYFRVERVGHRKTPWLPKDILGRECSDQDPLPMTRINPR